MKQFLINIKDLLKRGFLEIFPKPAIAIAIAIVLIGCSTQRHIVTQRVEHTSVDTIYLSNVQYDSIYIYQDHVSEHHLGNLPPVDSKGQYLNAPMRTDTLYIKDKSIEYRYKLLRDTIRVVQRDSIPYEVTITETKVIRRPLTWYDHLSRAVLWLNIGFVLLMVIRYYRKLKKGF